MKLPDHKTCKIAIIGLGYVGLPLAVEFSRERLKDKDTPVEVIGFDINSKRVADLKSGIDIMMEFDAAELSSVVNLCITDDQDSLKDIDVYIVTVPTPIDDAKKPDLKPLISASKMIGEALKARDNGSSYNPVIIYESTVYPGATEEVCIPIIEEHSSLVLNKDFGCGYSPERISPGDKKRTLSNITKITSGSSENVSQFVDELYKLIISAGTFRARSIKVAEAAKVIENTQRDLNVALVNELSIIFQKMGIQTLEVLEAAATKWNFLPFKPGLVGGHCIGVDPYYLLYKSEMLGYSPQVVLAGRRINDGYGKWIVDQLIEQMLQKSINPCESDVLVLGYTFKEDCPDTRNTRVKDIVDELVRLNISVTVIDPYINASCAKGLVYSDTIDNSIKYDGIIAAVSHLPYRSLSTEEWRSISKENSVILDIKGIVPLSMAPWRV